MDIFKFCTDLITSLKEIAGDVVSWFTTDISIPLINLTIEPISLLFGSGLLVFLGVLIVKAVI